MQNRERRAASMVNMVREMGEFVTAFSWQLEGLLTFQSGNAASVEVGSGYAVS